ncbi:multiple epidermal growth factor domains protein 10, partial [Biomphalaria glabrata]
ALSTLRVSIKESNLESPCTNLRFFQVDAMTFDVYCDCNGVMTTLKLAGDIVASICTILVNGGRNVALFQNTSQTSTYSSESNFGPQKAVDGVVEPTCYNKGCSHTTNEPNRDPHPSWTVIFDQPYAIDKFVIYNR